MKKCLLLVCNHFKSTSSSAYLQFIVQIRDRGNFINIWEATLISFLKSEPGCINMFLETKSKYHAQFDNGTQSASIIELDKWFCNDKHNVQTVLIWHSWSGGKLLASTLIGSGIYLHQVETQIEIPLHVKCTLSSSNSWKE